MWLLQIVLLFSRFLSKIWVNVYIFELKSSFLNFINLYWDYYYEIIFFYMFRDGMGCFLFIRLELVQGFFYLRVWRCMENLLYLYVRNDMQILFTYMGIVREFFLFIRMVVVLIYIIRYMGRNVRVSFLNQLINIDQK